MLPPASACNGSLVNAQKVASGVPRDGRDATVQPMACFCAQVFGAETNGIRRLSFPPSTPNCSQEQSGNLAA